MDADSTARMIYLGILLIVIGGWFLLQNRGAMGKMAQYAAVWALIFIGAISAVGLWSDIRQDVVTRQSVSQDGTRIEVPRSRDGHYYLTLTIDGVPVNFTVDTGATSVVLSPEDARRVGIDTGTLAYLGQARTANGNVRTARVTLEDVRLGGIVDNTLPAFVNEAPMDSSLLGMAYLNRFDRIEIADARLILVR